MQCTCSSGGCCKPCGIAKGLIMVALAVLYWLNIGFFGELRVFLSLLVILAGLGFVFKSLKGSSGCCPTEAKAAPEKKKK